MCVQGGRWKERGGVKHAHIEDIQLLLNCVWLLLVSYISNTASSCRLNLALNNWYCKRHTHKKQFKKCETNIPV